MTKHAHFTAAVLCLQVLVACGGETEPGSGASGGSSGGASGKGGSSATGGSASGGKNSGATGGTSTGGGSAGAGNASGASPAGQGGSAAGAGNAGGSAGAGNAGGAPVAGSGSGATGGTGTAATGGTGAGATAGTGAGATGGTGAGANGGTGAGAFGNNTGTPCQTDAQCPGNFCGGDVCVTGICKPASIYISAGTCLSDLDCKCTGEGATCNPATKQCTVINPGGGVGGTGSGGTGQAGAGNAAGTGAGNAAGNAAGTGSGGSSSGGEPCNVDSDCAGGCGAQVCESDEVFGPKKCKVPGTVPQGYDGTCSNDSDCKCSAQGAFCDPIRGACTFSMPVSQSGAISPAGFTANLSGHCWYVDTAGQFGTPGARRQAISLDYKTPPQLPINALLYFSTDCNPHTLPFGSDNLNDTGAPSPPGLWFFKNHPDDKNTSAIWSIADWHTGCLDYSNAPDCQ